MATVFVSEKMWLPYIHPYCWCITVKWRLYLYLYLGYKL